MVARRPHEGRTVRWRMSASPCRPGRLPWIALATIGLVLMGQAAAQSCQLRVLARSDAPQVHQGIRDQLIDPGPNQRHVIAEAAAYLTPLHCHAVEQVAFVRDAGDDSGTMGWVYVAHDNDTLHIDARPARASENDLDPRLRPRVVGNVWAAAIETVVHESTHAAVHLLHTQLREGDCLVGPIGCDAPTAASQWDADAIEAARAAAERARLGGGFLAEWTRMHDAFVDAGMALAYGGDGSPAVVPGAGAAAMAAGGFMTAYGSTEPSEDVAEMVAQAQTATLSNATFAGADVSAARADLACQALRAGGGDLTGATAAVYAKLAFLRDVGLVSGPAFERCVGPAGIDVRGADGFHVWDRDVSDRDVSDRDAGYRRTFGGLEVTLGTQASSGRTVFVLEGSGRAIFGSGDDAVETAAEMRLTLDLADADEPIERVSWPRGVYRLGEGANAFSLTLEDAPAGSFVASHGFVLVTSATAERSEGSIVLQRADRPFAPLGVPYAADELPRITFRVSSSP